MFKSVASLDADDAAGELYDRFDGKIFKDGFEIREVRIKSLITENVKPTLEEAQIFNVDAEAEMDIDDPEAEERRKLRSFAELQQQVKKKVHFEKGDPVIVTEGELKNLQGVVFDVPADGENIIIKASGVDESGKRIEIGNVPVLRDHLKYDPDRPHLLPDLLYFTSSDIGQILNSFFVSLSAYLPYPMP